MTKETLDLFERQYFATQLLDDLDCFKTPFSVGLDARWGNGKTFFVDNFLKAECVKRGIPLIKYDCFEHERENDPFISLVKVILDSAKLLVSGSTNEPQTDQLHNAYSKATSFAVGLLKTTGKAFVKHALGQTIAQVEANFDVEVPDELHDELAAYVEEQLKPARQLQDLRQEFYSSMDVLIQSISNSKFVIVVIDELDRCRPNHAVNVLESIKHLMSVKGVYFVFTYHREQLCSALKHIYGDGLDANLYLQKFIDLDLPLPGVGIPRNSQKYDLLFRQHLAKTSVDDNFKNQILSRVGWYSRLANIYDFTPRDIHRCLMLEIAYYRKDQGFLSLPSVSLLITMKVKFGNIDWLTEGPIFPVKASKTAELKFDKIIGGSTAGISGSGETLMNEMGFIFFDEAQYRGMRLNYPSQSEIVSKIQIIRIALGTISR